MIVLNELTTRIKLRRNSQSVYDSHPDFVPLDGEVCLSDGDDGELQLKVGDGTSTFEQLDWVFARVLKGYFYQGDFYKDLAHTQRYGRYKNSIYIELKYNETYFYSGTQYLKIGQTVGPASPTEFGVVKLYNSIGQNTDGTIDQKTITDTVTVGVTGENIKFNLPIAEI